MHLPPTHIGRTQSPLPRMGPVALMDCQARLSTYIGLRVRTGFSKLQTAHLIGVTRISLCLLLADHHQEWRQVIYDAQLPSAVSRPRDRALLAGILRAFWDGESYVHEDPAGVDIYLDDTFLVKSQRSRPPNLLYG